MEFKELYKNYPPRYRLVVVLVSFLVLVFTPLNFPWSVLFVAALVVLSVVVVSSIFFPWSYYSIQQDGRNRERVDDYNKLVDVLYNGKVLDDETTTDDVVLSLDSQGGFYFKTEQIGKTEKQIKDAVNNSLLAFGAASVDVEQVSNNEYLITYYNRTELERLSDVNITYSKLLELVGYEH